LLHFLIPVGVRLVGSIDGNANVLALLSAQHGELGSEASQVQPGDLLVQDLGQNVDVSGGVLAALLLLPELELGKGLVGETGTHDETGVAGGASQVQQASLGKDDDAVVVGPDELVNLGLDVVPSGGLHQTVHVDLVVKVSDVSNDGVVLHLLHGLLHQNSLVSGGGDENVGPANNVVEGGDGEALHARLQGADGVNLSDVNDGAAGAHGLGASLSDVSVAADDGLFVWWGVVGCGGVCDGVWWGKMD